MELSSPAFAPHGPIPTRHTCEGDDVAPALHWRDVPPGTRSLVLILEDPDAPDPDAPRRIWVHWVLVDLPPDCVVLPDGGRPLPAGAREGINDWNRRGYGGPCPPVDRHRYFFRLYALDTTLPALQHPSKAMVEQAIKGHVLARAELVGMYRKTRP